MSSSWDLDHHDEDTAVAQPGAGRPAGRSRQNAGKRDQPATTGSGAGMWTPQNSTDNQWTVIAV
ncbi:hypothetical protein GCM10027161_47630 [Microbispora hainanensis]